MLFRKRAHSGWFLGLAFLLNFPAQNAFSDQIGLVDYALQWGSSVQSYTYVFAGTITCQNRPCANARVELDFISASDGVITQSTQVGEDGRYQIEVTLQAAPDASSTWKLAAHSTGVSQRASAEAEGRVILRDGENTVVVERPLHLTQV